MAARRKHTRVHTHTNTQFYHSANLKQPEQIYMQAQPSIQSTFNAAEPVPTAADLRAR